MDKKVLYIIILIIAAGITAFLVSRPVSPEESRVVTIIGMWESATDENFVREFQEDGILIDVYANQVVDQGTWTPFTKNSPVATDFPLEVDTVYLQITGKDGARQMKVVSITGEELELMYLGSTESIRFVRPK